MSKSDLVFISLTERQEEVLDWMMGTPMIDHWGETDTITVGYEQEFSKPKLEDGRFAFPPVHQFVDHVEDELEKYQQMAMDVAEVDTVQSMLGLERVCSNILEKMREEIDSKEHEFADHRFEEVNV